MDAMALVLTTALVLTGFVAWGMIGIGIRIGGLKASRYIVQAFTRDLDLKDSLNEMERINMCLKEGLPWYFWEERVSTLGGLLLSIGISKGAAQIKKASAPKPYEANITMNRQELSDIAWLADYGLRVWTMPRDNYVRHGERLSKDRAEQMSSALDSFERKLAPWPSETEDEKERRFGNYEERMKRMWEYYD